MYKLVAIDLDGTLLNSKKGISEVNIRTIKAAIDAGIHILVCSGRIYSGARIYGSEIGTKLPLITCNGARIKDMNTNKVLYSKPLELNTCKRIVDACHSLNIYYHIYVGDTMYTEKLGYSSLFYWDRNKELPEESKIDIAVVDDMKHYLEKYSEDISKVVVMSDNPAKLSEARETIGLINGIEIMSSNYDNFEIMTEGVSKGSALKFMAERYGVSREEVMALGDNENDLSMLEYAGFSVAMGNAEDYVKEIADYITLTNDEDGVAYAINKFILSEAATK